MKKPYTVTYKASEYDSPRFRRAESQETWMARGILSFFALMSFVIFVAYATANNDFVIPMKAHKALEFGGGLNNKLENFQIRSVVVGEDYKNERASYAYEYSGYDKDFVLTLNAECGSWACGLHKLKYSREGQLWSDYGLCGISAYYHTEKYVEAKNSDWKREIEICHDLYVAGTRFYGFDHRHARGKNINFIF